MDVAALLVEEVDEDADSRRGTSIDMGATWTVIKRSEHQSSSRPADRGRARTKREETGEDPEGG
ncbi:uncharacterized protein LAESUDRAFT_723137 [Laetiporus sulphureus 93-53]|uniref:Uncharacterized protein n=1 Tax=Laetiporus sulphureus 93-53 TaxID=1314785 RepID=A0A165FT86_9APHY|nr:uncharacterized protein LAESUDRAFT_723137 [Laetiporus sulphureus 93-53]KZT09379.1 hypothetical protein LAESUDRAFT_723137 [Laetiporus sulphureus 93-53]